jgi:RNA polymerase sigma-70 factor, ECF subfamily
LLSGAEDAGDTPPGIISFSASTPVTVIETDGEAMGDSLQITNAKDESILVAEAKAGNYAAFEELVNRYGKKIYRLGLNITGNREDGEDVLQETLLKAFEHLPEFRGDSRFYTWLVRIAVNEGLMKLRKRRSDKSVPLEDSLDEDGGVVPREFTDERPNPEELAARAELEELVDNAARTLPPVFRTVFYLRDVEGLSIKDTAALLRATVGTIKSRIFRMHSHLRLRLINSFT